MKTVHVVTITEYRFDSISMEVSMVFANKTDAEQYAKQESSDDGLRKARVISMRVC